MLEANEYEALRLEPLAHAIQSDALEEVLGRMAQKLGKAASAPSIGIVAIDGTHCRRFRVTPNSGQAETCSERFRPGDCDVTVVITADALSDVLSGELSPFEALASHRLRYSGNANALMSVVTFLAGLPENSVPAPCEDVAS